MHRSRLKRSDPLLPLEAVSNVARNVFGEAIEVVKGDRTIEDWVGDFEMHCTAAHIADHHAWTLLILVDVLLQCPELLGRPALALRIPMYSSTSFSI